MKNKTKKKKQITPKTRLNEILQMNENAAEILFKSRMGCVGCPAAMMETLEQGCLAHGMAKKEIDKIIKRLNKEKKG